MQLLKSEYISLMDGGIIGKSISIMNNYTIAERQVIKDELATEEHFEKDAQFFKQLFPKHVLASECKRVNNMNRLSLDKRMIYYMLTRVTKEDIIAYRQPGLTESTSTQHEKAKGIANNLVSKALSWLQKIKQAR